MANVKQTSIQHIAITLDGNRRWAVEQGVPKFKGHTEGAKNLKRIGQALADYGIPYVTLYTLSTENLKRRSEEELKHLFMLFAKLMEHIEDFAKQHARVQIIGDPTALPQHVQEALDEVVEKTKDNTGMVLNIAMNYGGRDELVRAVKRLVDAGVSSEEITEDRIQAALDTKDCPDVDLMIRTGGAQRTSNFLPWQSVYAELYFTPVFWPAFSLDDLDEAIVWFEAQKRNRGK